MNYQHHVKLLTPPTKAKTWWVTLPAPRSVSSSLQWARSLPWPPEWQVVEAVEVEVWDRYRRTYLWVMRICLEPDPFWWRANLPILPAQRIVAWLENSLERIETSSPHARIRALRSLQKTLSLVRAWAEHADPREVTRFAGEVASLVTKAKNLPKEG